MKFKLSVIIDVDYDMYHTLINKGYNHYQIYHNIVDNIRNMFGQLLKYWDKVIRDIEIEEVEEEMGDIHKLSQIAIGGKNE
jgi:hypothetical protein